MELGATWTIAAFALLITAVLWTVTLATLRALTPPEDENEGEETRESSGEKNGTIRADRRRKDNKRRGKL